MREPPSQISSPWTQGTPGEGTHSVPNLPMLRLRMAWLVGRERFTWSPPRHANCDWRIDHTVGYNAACTLPRAKSESRRL